MPAISSSSVIITMPTPVITVETAAQPAAPSQLVNPQPSALSGITATQISTVQPIVSTQISFKPTFEPMEIIAKSSTISMEQVAAKLPKNNDGSRSCTLVSALEGKREICYTLVFKDGKSFSMTIDEMRLFNAVLFSEHGWDVLRNHPAPERENESSPAAATSNPVPTNQPSVTTNPSTMSRDDNVKESAASATFSNSSGGLYVSHHHSRYPHLGHHRPNAEIRCCIDCGRCVDKIACEILPKCCDKIGNGCDKFGSCISCCCTHLGRGATGFFKCIEPVVKVVFCCFHICKK